MKHVLMTYTNHSPHMREKASITHFDAKWQARELTGNIFYVSDKKGCQGSNLYLHLVQNHHYTEYSRKVMNGVNIHEVCHRNFIQIGLIKNPHIKYIHKHI